MPSSPIQLHDLDVPTFIKALDECTGNIYLVTRDGDNINLKSKLSQLVGVAKLIEGGKIAEAYIICEKIEDESRLFRLNLYGKSGMNPK